MEMLSDAEGGSGHTQSLCAHANIGLLAVMVGTTFESGPDGLLNHNSHLTPS